MTLRKSSFITKYIKQCIGFVFFISLLRLYSKCINTNVTISKQNYHPNTFGIDLYDGKIDLYKS